MGLINARKQMASPAGLCHRLVNQRLLLQNEYLAAENRILRSRFPARMRLSDPERSTLAEIGKRLGRAALQYHSERNHQGKGNLLLFPSPDGALSPKRRVVN